MNPASGLYKIMSESFPMIMTPWPVTHLHPALEELTEFGMQLLHRGIKGGQGVRCWGAIWVRYAAIAVSAIPLSGSVSCNPPLHIQSTIHLQTFVEASIDLFRYTCKWFFQYQIDASIDLIRYL